MEVRQANRTIDFLSETPRGQRIPNPHRLPGSCPSIAQRCFANHSLRACTPHSDFATERYPFATTYWASFPNKWYSSRSPRSLRTSVSCAYCRPLTKR